MPRPSRSGKHFTRILPVLLLAWTGSAQAAVVLSNLTEATGEYAPVSNSTIGAWSFTTGSTASTLNSVAVTLGPAVATGGNFVLRIGLDTGAGHPTGFISGFTGATQPDGSAGGTAFTFTPSTSVALSANTTYWLMFGAQSGGTYNLITTYSDSFATSGGWSGSTDAVLSLDSAHTWTETVTDMPKVSIDVTAVPEPSSWLAVGSLMLAGVAWGRRRLRR